MHCRSRQARAEPRRLGDPTKWPSEHSKSVVNEHDITGLQRTSTGHEYPLPSQMTEPILTMMLSSDDISILLRGRVLRGC
ncbi:hypothetical protein BC629DRAFT_1504141 [Irpex lacteus]|nr:hypothetical protein BC629DRAFT_1504141 [Irpex lacteus]